MSESAEAFLVGLFTGFFGWVIYRIFCHWIVNANFYS